MGRKAWIAVVVVVVAAVAVPLVDTGTKMAKVRARAVEVRKSYEVSASVVAAWRQDVDLVHADAALWELLLAPRTADAGDAFGGRLRFWGQPPGRRLLPPLPVEVVDALGRDDLFLHADEFPETDVDLGWMAGLVAFTHYDLERSPVWQSQPGEPVVALPRPEVVELFRWARLRLVRGLLQDEMVEASKEVRALARLLWSMDALLPGVVAAEMLKSDHEARAVARKIGVRVEGPDLPSAPLLKDVTMSAVAMWSTVTPATLRAYEATDLRLCPSFGESLNLYLLGRPHFARANAARDVALGELLAASPCLLTRQRRQWQDGTGAIVPDFGNQLGPLARVFWRVVIVDLLVTMSPPVLGQLSQ
jgi:hypothetical protein